MCLDQKLMDIMGVIKFFIQAGSYLVPVLLVIFIIIEVFKVVTSGDVDTKKLGKNIIVKVIAGILVFLIFPITNLVISLFGGDNEYANCYEQANVIVEETNITELT